MEGQVLPLCRNGPLNLIKTVLIRNMARRYEMLFADRPSAHREGVYAATCCGRGRFLAWPDRLSPLPFLRFGREGDMTGDMTGDRTPPPPDRPARAR